MLGRQCLEHREDGRPSLSLHDLVERGVGTRRERDERAHAALCHASVARAADDEVEGDAPQPGSPVCRIFAGAHRHEQAREGFSGDVLRQGPIAGPYGHPRHKRSVTASEGFLQGVVGPCRWPSRGDAGAASARIRTRPLRMINRLPAHGSLSPGHRMGRSCDRDATYRTVGAQVPHCGWREPARPL